MNKTLTDKIPHHTCSDTSLNVRSRTSAATDRVSWTLLEIAEVGFGSDYGRHGGDVKAEQTTSNDGDGCNEVDIANLFYHISEILARKGDQENSRMKSRGGEIMQRRASKVNILVILHEPGEPSIYHYGIVA